MYLVIIKKLYLKKITPNVVALRVNKQRIGLFKNLAYETNLNITFNCYIFGNHKLFVLEV